MQSPGGDADGVKNAAGRGDQAWGGMSPVQAHDLNDSVSDATAFKPLGGAQGGPALDTGLEGNA